jgi:hypothetical protein
MKKIIFVSNNAARLEVPQGYFEHGTARSVPLAAGFGNTRNPIP